MLVLNDSKHEHYICIVDGKQKPLHNGKYMYHMNNAWRMENSDEKRTFPWY